MIELLPFFIVLFAGVFFSEFFIRFHFPWVVALLIGGMIIGPSGLGFVTPDATMEFLGRVGLVFLMFMAGLESNLFKKRHTKSIDPYIQVAFLSSVIPFVLGVFTALYFGFDKNTTFFLGIIFISSSIAAIVPSLEAKGILRCKLGRTIISSVIVSDVLSLVALSVMLQSISPATKLPLPLFYIMLVAVIFFLKWIIPKIRWFFKKEIESARDIFQQELRSIFVILIGTALFFELLGVHSIVAGFFAGLVLSDSIKSNILKENLRAISYGVFIPIFFLLIGAQTDVVSLFNSKEVFKLTFVLIVVAIFSKLFSGFIGGKSIGLTNKESLILSSSTVPQLSTTLAVALTGKELGILSSEIITALVILSIVTTIIGSFMIRIFSKNYIRDEVEAHEERAEIHYG